MRRWRSRRWRWGCSRPDQGAIASYQKVAPRARDARKVGAVSFTVIQIVVPVRECFGANLCTIEQSEVGASAEQEGYCSIALLRRQCKRIGRVAVVEARQRARAVESASNWMAISIEVTRAAEWHAKATIAEPATTPVDGTVGRVCGNELGDVTTWELQASALARFPFVLDRESRSVALLSRAKRHPRLHGDFPSVWHSRRRVNRSGGTDGHGRERTFELGGVRNEHGRPLAHDDSLAHVGACAICKVLVKVKQRNGELLQLDVGMSVHVDKAIPERNHVG